MKRLLFLASLLILVPVGLIARRRVMRSSSRASDVVTRQYEAIQNQDWDTLADIYSSDVQYRDPEAELYGKDAVVERARELEAPFINASFSPQFIRGDDSFAVTEWTYSGTPVELEGIAENRRITVSGLSFFEVRDGRIVEERSYWTVPQREAMAAV